MSFRRFLLAALPVAVIACDEPADPTGISMDPAFAAVVESGTGVLTGGGRLFNPCAGEFLLVQWHIPYTWRQVTTPSGVLVYHDRFLHQEATGSAVGSDSGTQWELVRNVSPGVQIQVAAGERIAFTAHQTLISEHGDKLQRHVLFVVIQNNDGAIIVENIEERIVAC